MSLDSLYSQVFAARAINSRSHTPSPTGAAGATSLHSLATRVYAARRDDVARYLTGLDPLPTGGRR